MDDSQLREVAQTNGIKKINLDDKENLVYEILDKQARDVAASSTANTPQKPSRQKESKDVKDENQQKQTRKRKKNQHRKPLNKTRLRPPNSLSSRRNVAANRVRQQPLTARRNPHLPLKQLLKLLNRHLRPQTTPQQQLPKNNRHKANNSQNVVAVARRAIRSLNRTTPQQPLIQKTPHRMKTTLRFHPQRRKQNRRKQC